MRFLLLIIGIPVVSIYYRLLIGHGSCWIHPISRRHTTNFQRLRFHRAADRLGSAYRNSFIGPTTTFIGPTTTSPGGRCTNAC